jgi:hypothetical protein
MNKLKVFVSLSILFGTNAIMAFLQLNMIESGGSGYSLFMPFPLGYVYPSIPNSPGNAWLWWGILLSVVFWISATLLLNKFFGRSKTA